MDNSISRQQYLIDYLREMGDPRLGGTLPLGGKAFAPGAVSRQMGEMAGVNFRGGPQMFLTDSAIGYRNEDAAYDHLMNMREQELEDLRKNDRIIRAIKAGGR